MRITRIISSSISVFLVFIILASTSGVTLVTHICHTCGQVSFTAESIFTKSNIEDNCCEDAHPSGHMHPYGAISNGCCEHKVVEVKINNFIPENHIINVNTVSEPFILDYPIIISQTDKAATKVLFYNKHGGGRSVITSNCQIIS